MPEQAEEEKIEGQEQVQEEQNTQQEIDWENDSNPYKKRYGDSQGQIQPLVRTLNQFAEYDHNTKNWRLKNQEPVQQKSETDDDFEKRLEAYDPDFVKALGGYISPMRKELAELRKERQDSAFMNEYNSSVTAARSKSIEEFGSEFDFAKGGKFNTESPLYKLANEILTEKYAIFNPDGTFHRYRSPDSEYMSTVEAYAILSKRAKQPQVEKGKFSAIQGKGTKSGGITKKLNYEEYNKLSTEDKDAYDLQQTG